MAFPKIGNIAPAFTLLDQDGNKVSLKQFRDSKNVVLYFYPKAKTGAWRSDFISLVNLDSGEGEV